MATARVAPEKQDFSTCPPFALPVGDGLERSMVFTSYVEKLGLKAFEIYCSNKKDYD